MNARTGRMRVLMILAVGAIGLAVTVRMSAQVETTTDTTHGASTKEVKVVNATVVAVSGNDLVLKMDDGTLRHFANVPDSARATVDGKEIGIRDAKVGMKLQKTITTTTTPKVITTTKTVTGKVWHVNPPLSLILTMEDGTNEEFKIPKGQKFNVNGKDTDAFGLKKGMVVSATKVVEEPITVVQQQAKLTGSMPPPPPAPPADQPILVAVVTPAAPAPAPAPAEAAPAALPKTGSELPLTGLLGFLSLAGSAGVRLFRKFSR
jgi:LPXTG-motif cell wall-anchored protein